MKIYELHLKNCKCYEDKIINFQEGLNFISGVNGAGKTTIIEAIGLVLFNYLPYNAKQFVRDGKKSGEIQALIGAKDERLYRIIRKFNKTTKTLKWEVYDEETNTCLDELHGSDDVSRWIKESIGIDPEGSLEKIFEQVIAVNQGLFAAPFLETNANRKRIFDEILKVAGYREAFEKSRSLKSYIEGEEKELKAITQHLEEEIKDIPTIEEEITKNQQEYEKQAQNYEAAQQKQQQLELKDTEWTKLKETIDARQNEKNLLEQTLFSLKEKMDSLEKQKEEAKKARVILAETKEAYLRYQNNQAELRGWEEKKKQRDALKEDLDKAEKDHSTEEKGIEVETKNNELRAQELQEKLKALQTQESATTQSLQAIEEDLKRVMSWETREVSRFFDAWQNWFNNNRSLVADAHYALQSVEELTAEIKEIQNEIKDLPQKEEDLSLLVTSIAKGEELLQKKSSLIARKEALVQNETHLAAGRCPIIQEACPSQKVAGDLSSYFARELKEIEEGLAHLTEQLAQHEKQKAKHDELKEQLTLARNQKSTMEKKEKLQKEKTEELRRLVKKVSLKEALDLIETGQREYLALEKLINEINLWLSAKDFITIEPFNYQPLHCQAIIDLLTEIERTGLDDTGQIRDWLTKWDQLEADSQKWLEQAQEQVKEYQKWLSDILQAVRLKEQEIKQQQEFCLNEIKDYQNQEKHLNNKNTELETRRENLNLLKKEIDKLTDSLAQFSQVEDTVDSLKKALENDQKSYDLYNENKQASERLEIIEQEIKECQATVSETNQKIETLQAELNELLSNYDSAKHQDLKDELKQASEQVTELKVYIEQIKKDAKRLKEQLDELLKKKSQWEQNRYKLLVKNKTRELAQTIRETLKDAADPVAHVYRQYLSAEANEIYRHVSNENVQVEWASEYELQLKDNFHYKERVRVFKQLSGGEQMTAALAVRLALMKMLSDVKLGFFDEPTTNLDSSRRQNLAMAIQKSTKGFEQLFVISHDDAFDSLTENTISLEKDEG
ncbi:AAA family ATPase [Dethiobacter alkaliphilus]|uniref:AAA family ATPase n=1 Tax=Dethiobacter alkaliphilus TaxID=427926 RepID=UPI002225E560|nr:AAA family ATPase [Dethiobacter alkaliphilus]MCW3490490.1 AAA family ATPase [Dethiobacter alkaliphilus]